jgi:hypothetical protein
MNFDRCEHCEFRFLRNDELIRHMKSCSVRLNRARRVVSRSTISLSNNLYNNERKRRRSNTIDNNIQKNEIFDLTNETLASSSNVANADEQQSKLLEHFLLNNRSNILSISFFIRIQTYEDEINRKTETIINEELDEKHSRSRLVFEDQNEFWSFQSEHDYEFALWLHHSENTKRDVNRFFKNSRMTFFHEQLSFKNENEWLCQLNNVIEVSDDKWIEQNINISFEIDDELNDVIQIQYRDIMKEIKFLIEHSSFSANLSYALIRQFNDDNERIYFEMHIEDWWWKKQNEISEKTTIISLLISNDKIMLSQHQDDRATWSVYLTIKNLNREMKRNQSRSDSLLLNFISHDLSSRNRLKTNVWHKTLSFMFKRKLARSTFKVWRINFSFLINYQRLCSK